ncbi:MAG: hypothetical protein AB8B55_13070 [Mariniblastus sp.]
MNSQQPEHSRHPQSTKKMEDYPAAHSMDSTWFAVDAEGNIASFETHEAGAAPDDAYIDQGALEPEELVTILTQTEYVIDVDDLIVDPDGDVYCRKDWKSNEMVKYRPSRPNITNEYSCLFWLKDETLFESENSNPPKKWLGIIQRGPTPLNIVRIPHPRAILGFVETIPVSVLNELKTESAFHKCWLHFNFDCSRLGWFGFEHGDMFENWTSGPYQKTSVPKVPMKLEQLPEKLRAEISKAKLENANFTTDRTIQPFEHLPSGGWENQCIDSNGVTHNLEDPPNAIDE